jgi:uncharacterized protein (DUF305 family)
VTGPNLGAGAAGRAARPVQRRGLLWAVFVTVVILTALAFFAIGRLSGAPQQISDDGPDAGFARDMQVHHAQAVEMALIIRDTSTNEEIRAVAYDIATTQQHQKGQMFAWLQGWGLSQAGKGAPMAWMGAGSGDHGQSHGASAAAAPQSQMEGMATPEQMQALRAASGTEADRLFTDLMIRHHQGGVAMATAAVNLAETARVRDFAAGLVEAQSAEILALQDLRARL